MKSTTIKIQPQPKGFRTAFGMQRYWRNAVVLPMYEFTTRLANLAEPPSSQMRQLLAALCGNQTEINRFLGTWAGTVPVQEFFTPENVQRILNTK